jgi:hypothetical protein
VASYTHDFSFPVGFDVYQEYPEQPVIYSPSTSDQTISREQFSPAYNPPQQQQQQQQKRKRSAQPEKPKRKPKKELMTDTTGPVVADNKPKRVRTGCLTCRERHLKCDEGTPDCVNCRKSNRKCKRGVRLNFIDTQVKRPPVIPVAPDYKSESTASIVDFTNLSSHIPR